MEPVFTSGSTARSEYFNHSKLRHSRRGKIHVIKRNHHCKPVLSSSDANTFEESSYSVPPHIMIKVEISALFSTKR